MAHYHYSHQFGQVAADNEEIVFADEFIDLGDFDDSDLFLDLPEDFKLELIDDETNEDA